MFVSRHCYVSSYNYVEIIRGSCTRSRRKFKLYRSGFVVGYINLKATNRIYIEEEKNGKPVGKCSSVLFASYGLLIAPTAISTIHVCRLIVSRRCIIVETCYIRVRSQGK